MNSDTSPSSFFIGWDVGAWNCDNNRNARDAIVILDTNRSMVGNPWRGNLRESINDAVSIGDWIDDLFLKCEAVLSVKNVGITMAIDAPLGFSCEFVQLVTDAHRMKSVGDSKTNRYLFRQTERHLFERGFTPLSAIKDMIGSQATKGMHAIAKFAPVVESCGVWTNGDGFHAIETYPTACGHSERIVQLLDGFGTLGNDDLNDARVCALVAYLFGTERESLEPPNATVPQKEGWIWYPR